MRVMELRKAPDSIPTGLPCLEAAGGYGGPGQPSTFVGGLGDTGYLWTATTNPDKTVQLLEFWGSQGYFSYIFGEGGLTPDFGMAVRCIRD